MPECYVCHMPIMADSKTHTNKIMGVRHFNQQDCIDMLKAANRVLIVGGSMLINENERLRAALKNVNNDTCENGHLFIGGNPLDVSWDDLKCTRCGFRFIDSPLR